MRQTDESGFAYCIFETAHGVLNTFDNREVRVLLLENIGTTPTTLGTSYSPYVPGAVITGKHQEARLINLQIHAPNSYRPQMIRVFATGGEGRLIVNWGGQKRFIDYVVQESEIVQETIAKRLLINITLFCPDVYWNDMDDFGQNIAATVPLINFPNLWFTDSGLMSCHKMFESSVALENKGDVPIGIKFVIRASKGPVLNPVIFLSEDVFFRVYVRLEINDELEISTVRREKFVRLNGKNILNRVDMTSTFFEIAPGERKLYYDAADGLENMNIFLHRRPQYVGV